MSPDSRRHPRNLWQERGQNAFTDGIGARESSEDDRRQDVSSSEAKEWQRAEESRSGSGKSSEWNFESFSSHLNGGHQCLEYCPICRFADLVRTTASPELRSQLAAWQRESALALRALLDYYIERLADRGPEDRVEDIPIE